MRSRLLKLSSAEVRSQGSRVGQAPGSFYVKPQRASAAGFSVSIQHFSFAARHSLHHGANINMAGPSDKARFFLEQSATELNELERKKIFTRVSRMHHCAEPGLMSIVCRKRSAL